MQKFPLHFYEYRCTLVSKIILDILEILNQGLVDPAEEKSRRLKWMKRQC